MRKTVIQIGKPGGFGYSRLVRGAVRGDPGAQRAACTPAMGSRLTRSIDDGNRFWVKKGAC